MDTTINVQGLLRSDCRKPFQQMQREGNGSCCVHRRDGCYHFISDAWCVPCWCISTSWSLIVLVLHRNNSKSCKKSTINLILFRLKLQNKCKIKQPWASQGKRKLSTREKLSCIIKSWRVRQIAWGFQNGERKVPWCPSLDLESLTLMASFLIHLVATCIVNLTPVIQPAYKTSYATDTHKNKT